MLGGNLLFIFSFGMFLLLDLNLKLSRDVLECFFVLFFIGLLFFTLFIFFVVFVVLMLLF